MKHCFLFLLIASISLMDGLQAETELPTKEKEIPNVPRVDRSKKKKRSTRTRTYFHLPLVGDMLANRLEDIRYDLLDPVKDKALIDKHRIPIWPFPNGLREKDKPAAYALVRNRLIAFYTKHDGTDEDESDENKKIYRVDLYYESTHYTKLKGLMANFRYIRYVTGKAGDRYCKGIYRTGKVQVAVHIRRHGKFTGRELGRIPIDVNERAPFVLTMELPPVERYALARRTPDSVLAAMRKGEIHLGMYKREVQAALAEKYHVQWGENTARVNRGKSSYTIHFENDVVKTLTR